MLLKTEKTLTFCLFLCIPFLLFAVFIIYPIFRTVVLSFQEWDGISEHITFIGFQNYQKVFNSDMFHISLQNNIKWLIFSLIVPTALGLTLALLIDQKIKMESAFQVVFFLPYAVTPVVVASVWGWLYAPRGGFINEVLVLAGMPQMRQIWLGDPRIATYSIMVANLWWSSGFALILFFSGLRAIPQELLEAADIDGASFVIKLRKIIIPQLLPSTIVVMGTQGIGAMRIFDLVYSMTRGGPGDATHVLATSIYHFSFNLFEMGAGSAMAVILLLISAVIILPYIHHSTKKLGDIQN
jgi:ABC-type sugar transport system permease subunit